VWAGRARSAVGGRRPPIVARATGSPAGSSRSRTQAARLSPVSLLLLALGEAAGNSSLSPSVSGSVARPAWACNRPDRTPRTYGPLRRACHDHHSDRRQRPRAGAQFPLAVFVHVISRHVRAVRGEFVLHPLTLLFDRNHGRHKVACAKNTPVRCRSPDQPAAGRSRRDRGRRGRERARPRRPPFHRCGHR